MDQVRCTLCNIWHHNKCVDEPPTGMVWTCPSCSKTASLIQSLHGDIAQIKDTNKELLDLLAALKDDFKKEREIRINTEQEIWMLRGQFKELVEELNTLTNKGLLGTNAHPDPSPKMTEPTPSDVKLTKTAPLESPMKTTTPPAPPEPTKTLLIGNSLLRNVNSAKLKDCEVMSKGGVG